jgi:quercetin dioxygenase-like cupin family protein
MAALYWARARWSTRIFAPSWRRESRPNGAAGVRRGGVQRGERAGIGRSVGGMVRLISTPRRIPVPGGKLIDEFVGRVSTGTEGVSVAQMAAPPGWDEPAQTPEFDEVTVVLSGSLVVEHDGTATEVGAGQAILTPAGETVRYVAGPDGASYIAVCVPAFGPELAHRADEPS